MSLWFLLKLKNGFISSGVLVQLLQHSLFYYTFPLHRRCVPGQLSFFCGMIYALANPSQSQAGKDVFSAIARCQGQGLWFRACGSVAAVKGGRGSRPVRSDMGQWRMWRPWRKWKDFLVFQGLFFYMLGEGEVLVCRFQLNVMDQTSWKINTHTDAHFVILFIAHRVIHSISCARVQEHLHTHTHAHMNTHLINTAAHHAVTLQLPWHCLYSKQTSQMKAQVHVRVSSTLMSWPKVMDCSLLQLRWVLPGFF